MSREDLEVVRRFHDPLDGKDVMPSIRAGVSRFGTDPDPAVVLEWWADDPSWQHAHPEIEWDTTSIPVIGTRVKGPRQVALWWIDWTEAWKSYVYRISRMRDLGEVVFGELTIEARGPDDVPVEMTVFQLFEVRDGKLAACRVFVSEAEALEAAGILE